MLATGFTAVVPLGADRPPIRTQRPAAGSDVAEALSWDSMWATLAQWAVMAYETHLDATDHTAPVASTSTAAPAADLSAVFLWSALVGLQRLSGAIDASSVATDGRSVTIADSLVISKSDGRSRAELATVDGLARLALLLRRTTSASQQPAPRPRRKVLADRGTSAPSSTAIAQTSVARPDVDKLARRVQALEEALTMRSLAEPRPPDIGVTPAVTVQLSSSAYRVGLAVCIGAPAVLAIAVLLRS